MADIAPVPARRKPPAAGKGRPKGALNKRTREIQDFSRDLVTDDAYIESLRRRLVSGRAAHMETLLHYYAWGKPKEQHEHTGGSGGPITFAWLQPQT